MTAIRRNGLAALLHAGRVALQWRLLVLWILAMQIPTVIVALPLWSSLSELLDHSVHSAEWARQFDAMAAGDVLSQLHGFNGVAAISMVFGVLLSPLLTAMAVTAVRATSRASFAELVGAGIRDFWLMARLLLWALLPFGIASAIGAGGISWASAFAGKTTLQSQADIAQHGAIGALVVMLCIAHALVESGRAQLAADPLLRSAWRALWRGTRMLWRRPLATLGMYFGSSVAGYAIALLLAMLRIRTTAVDWTGWLAAMLLTQAITAALAWQRTARLAGLRELALATVAAHTRPE